MKRIILSVCALSLSTLSFAAPTSFKTVYNDPKATQSTKYNQYDRDRYAHPPSYRYPSQHYPQRPHISVETPNIQIYYAPQPQYHYQQTEEVHLPYGGTYRKTTNYIPQTSPYPYVPPNRTVLKQGHYNQEE